MSRPAIFLLIASLLLTAGLASAYPNSCPDGVYSGDRVVIAAWAYQEAHVFGYHDYNWVSIAVPAKNNSISGLGGDYHLVSHFVCYRYGIELDATYTEFDGKRPSLTLNYTPSDTNHLESVSASATDGHIRFKVVGEGSHGFGWASISYAVTIHRNSGGDGGGSGSAELWLYPHGLPLWLVGEIRSGHGAWRLLYTSTGATRGTGKVVYSWTSGAGPTGLSFNPNSSLTLKHLQITYSPQFTLSRRTGAYGRAKAAASRAPYRTTLYLTLTQTSSVPAWAQAIFTLTDGNVEYARITGFTARTPGRAAVYLSNGTGWTKYTGGTLYAKRVKIVAFLTTQGSTGTVYVYASNIVELKPVRYAATWNGTGATPSNNGTLVSSSTSTSISFTAERPGIYVVHAWFIPVNGDAKPILPGVLLLPNLSAGMHVVSGSFEALLVNGSGGGLRMWHAALPLNVSVARGFSWRMFRGRRGGHLWVDAGNYMLLPKASGGVSGHLLALQSPTTLGPAELCVDANCTLYNVTRLVLGVEGEWFNGTHLVVRLRPSYECCPTTPLKEHLVYVLQLGKLTLESPRDATTIAVPVSLLEGLGPGPLKASLYARYSPGGKVPHQLVKTAILRGSVKLLAVRGSTLIFSRPYLWPTNYTVFTPQPWNGSPGTLWVRVGDTPWTQALWNGTNFTYTYSGSLDGATLEFLWIPPENTSQLILPLIQRWVLGRW